MPKTIYTRGDAWRFYDCYVILRTLAVSEIALVKMELAMQGTV